MKYWLYSFILMMLLTSCKDNYHEKARILEKINEVNSMYSMSVYYQFKDFRGDQTNQSNLNFAKQIRTSRDTLNYYLQNNLLNNDFNNLLKEYRQTLDEVCDSTGICDSTTLELLDKELSYIKRHPLNYLIQLSLSESDILIDLIATTGGHSGYNFFEYDFQFEKGHYYIGDTIKFVFSPHNTGYEINIQYDSIGFENLDIKTDKNVKLDYHLEQVIRTGIADFIPTKPGNYKINVYASFETGIIKQRQIVFSDVIRIKRNKNDQKDMREYENN